VASVASEENPSSSASCQQQTAVQLPVETVKLLRLRSAAAYLPHPEKESYGGEDAHFVSNVSGGAIGVADGELGAAGPHLLQPVLA
jgi:hypothetical protein